MTINKVTIRDKLIWKPTPPQLIILSFAFLILIGALLLTLPQSSAQHRGTDFLTALFTATSAVCVTGLVVVDTGTYWSGFGHVVILLLIQIGGLGFMTAATFFALLTGQRIGLRRRILMQESLNQVNLQGIVNLAKNVLIITASIELFFVITLALGWVKEFGLQKALWLGLFHSISAFNNAGFDLFGGFKSLTSYASNFIVNISITSGIILGGIGFSVIIELLTYRKKKRLSLHTKITCLTTIILILVGALVFYVLEYNNTLSSLNLTGKILASYFQSVTPRTAGYNTVDMAQLYGATQFFIVILMFIGASPGSTGGGIKTTTLATLVLAIISNVKGNTDIQAFKRRIPYEQFNKGVSVVLISFALITVVSLALMLTERQSFLTILFETVSAFGTVGLTVGLTPKLTEAGRILIILTMFLGRVGPLTLAVALGQRMKAKQRIRYPKEKVVIG